MLTFTSLGGNTVRVTGGDKPVVAWPQKLDTEGKYLQLVSVPEQFRTLSTLSWPGEYNESGISARGIGQDEGRQTSFVVKVDGVTVGFLSAPLLDWTDAQLEMISNIDVLVMPAGDVKVAQKLVDEIDPRILIVLPTAEGSENADVLKAVGAKGSEVDEYKLKGALPAEGREVVVLSK